MSESTRPLLAVKAAELASRRGASMPEPFATRLSRRVKHALGDTFGLKAFGVNLTRLAAGDASALHHRHTVQDEFVYVLEGHPTLVGDGGEVDLSPGMCAGFRASGPAHHLENRTDRDVLVLEVGDRAPGDQVEYPADDLALRIDPQGGRHYSHKDGKPY
ncbi:MAG TPA: cupin domain-containing protein [Anaeromyxobacter sp.]|nr:cupin domain-containing protein [Anaeromyxobacter sp.]